MSRIQVDNIFDKEGTGSPTFPAGSVVTGVSTATTFDGAFTGNVTGNVTGTATSAVNFSSVPNVVVGTVIGSQANFTSGVNAVGVVTSAEYDGYFMLDTSLF